MHLFFGKYHVSDRGYEAPMKDPSGLWKMEESEKRGGGGGGLVAKICMQKYLQNDWMCAATVEVWKHWCELIGCQNAVTDILSISPLLERLFPHDRSACTSLN